ncbi:alpha/beta hydrolase [Massilia violaceinigra]|uniref:Alpha/beta hydrolase n=1 Tax=Massilia violaceinigra TaxID=2045208 RepID=A0ABY4A6Y0_9BURK|nr:alpha/beta hydrolase [Massilia violaceinigra]UOD30543.1 alpha/beta hydrolase [Massilia violaceinigra]
MKKLHAALLGAILLGGLAACAPLPTLNALSPGSALRSGSGLAYGENARHRLDVYSPEDAGASAPVVVFFLGGNWTKGEREDYAFVGRALASRGMVAVIPDFRLHPEVSYPDFLDDSARAVAWTVREIARYGGDPKRLFVMGHSSGAYNAAMMALDAQWLAKQGMQPAALRGWIGLAGPYDFLPIENPVTKPVFHFPDTPPESQPINHARAGTPPALLIAANNDKLVDPVRNTRAMAARLRGKDVAVQELYFDKVSHATLVASIAAPLRFLAPTLDSVEQFVKSDAGRIAPPAKAN